MTLFLWSYMFTFMTKTDGSSICSLSNSTRSSRGPCWEFLCCNIVQGMQKKSKWDSWPSSMSRWEIRFEAHASVNVWRNMMLTSLWIARHCRRNWGLFIEWTKLSSTTKPSTQMNGHLGIVQISLDPQASVPNLCSPAHDPLKRGRCARCRCVRHSPSKQWW